MNGERKKSFADGSPDGTFPKSRGLFSTIHLVSQENKSLKTIILFFPRLVLMAVMEDVQCSVYLIFWMTELQQVTPSPVRTYATV